MSYAHDLELDRGHTTDPPPTADELVAVDAYKWGHKSLEWLYAKLGIRAIPVCAHQGIMSAAAVSPMPVITAAELARIPTAILEAEIERRRREEAVEAVSSVTDSEW